MTLPKKFNVSAHVDIDREIDSHIDDYLHFEVRCSGGNIVDLVVREFVDYEKIIRNPGIVSRDS